MRRSSPRCRWRCGGTAVIGLVFERTLYRRLASATHFDQVLFSIGLVFMSISPAHYFFGAQQQPLALPRLPWQIHLPGSTWASIDSS
jgi:branched-chain amino acid transport system permease protein